MVQSMSSVSGTGRLLFEDDVSLRSCHGGALTQAQMAAT